MLADAGFVISGVNVPEHQPLNARYVDEMASSKVHHADAEATNSRLRGPHVIIL